MPEIILFNKGYDCFLKDISVTLIDKTDASDPKERENHRMKTSRTLTSDGLNVEDSVWEIMIFHYFVCFTGLDCIMTAIFWNTIFDNYLYLFGVGNIQS